MAIVATTQDAEGKRWGLDDSDGSYWAGNPWGTRPVTPPDAVRASLNAVLALEAARRAEVEKWSAARRVHLQMHRLIVRLLTRVARESGPARPFVTAVDRRATLGDTQPIPPALQPLAAFYVRAYLGVNAGGERVFEVGGRRGNVTWAVEQAQAAGLTPVEPVTKTLYNNAHALLIASGYRVVEYAERSHSWSGEGHAFPEAQEFSVA